MNPLPPTTIDPTAGTTLSVGADTYRLVITGAQTNGEFAVIDMLVPPQGGPPPHAHAEFQESFFVIEGEIVVKSELGPPYTARKGAFVNIPRGGVVHAFKNETDTVAHLLCVVVPAGLDDAFLEIGTPVAPGQFLPPAMDEQEKQRMKGIAEKYHIKMLTPDYFDK